MDERDVTVEMPEQDYEGEIEKLTVQTNSRVKLPEQWLDSLGLEIGDEIAVVHDGDHVKILKWTRENVKEVL